MVAVDSNEFKLLTWLWHLYIIDGEGKACAFILDHRSSARRWDTHVGFEYVSWFPIMDLSMARSSSAPGSDSGTKDVLVMKSPGIPGTPVFLSKPFISPGSVFNHRGRASPSTRSGVDPALHRERSPRVCRLTRQSIARRSGSCDIHVEREGKQASQSINSQSFSSPMIYPAFFGPRKVPNPFQRPIIMTTNTPLQTQLFINGKVSRRGRIHSTSSLC